MGLLDRIRSRFDRGTSVSTDPVGPLGLAVGDAVGYWTERWVVVGWRVLETGSRQVVHYCLRDDAGARATMVTDRDDETLWLQRVVELDGPVGDVVEGVTDEPLRLSATETFRVRSNGDVGGEPSRSAVVREYHDEECEHVLVVEDHGGQTLARLGEAVHRAEITTGDAVAPPATAAAPVATPDGSAPGPASERPVDADTDEDDDDFAGLDDFDDDNLGDVDKGTPLAAALALEGRVAHRAFAATRAQGEGDEEGYADDEWADAQDAPERGDVGTGHSRFAHADTGTCDDWVRATRFVKGSGAHLQDFDDWLSE